MIAVEKARSLAVDLHVLPPLPEVARTILTRLYDEFITAQEVAEVVGKDPGITARLIALANSAYFGLSEPIGDLINVTNRVLGVDNVRSMAVALAAGDILDTSGCPSFDTRRFWVNALLMADATRRVINDDEEAGPTEVELAYQTGLCHNIGLLALAYLLPEPTHQALSDMENQAEHGKSLSARLIEATGTDHRQMTACVAGQWELPDAMVAAYGGASQCLLSQALDVGRTVVRDEVDSDEDTAAPDTSSYAPDQRQRQRIEAIVASSTTRD